MKVVVVGAGPAGAALSWLLARNGVEVVLVDREIDFERIFRGEGLMPSGVDALLQMGLGPLLDAPPGRRLEAWEIFIEGRPILSVPEPLEELGPRAPRIFPQPVLLEELVRRAREHGGFSFLPGVTVRDLVRDGGRVTGVEIHDAGATRTLDSDLVVAADGRASVVRSRAGLVLERLPEDFDVLWFKIPAPERLRDRCIFMMFASRRHMAACYTSWDGRLQLALVLRKGTFRDRRDANWVEELAASTPPWLADHVRSVGDRIEGPALLDVVVGRCRSWSAPGVLAIGDAAHPMSPIRAQGINVALRDAIVAANRLVEAHREGGGAERIDAAARQVQVEREPEIRRSQELQHRDTRGWNSRALPFFLGLAKFLGPRLGRYAWARRAWLDQQRDLRFGSAEVELRV